MTIKYWISIDGEYKLISAQIHLAVSLSTACISWEHYIWAKFDRNSEIFPSQIKQVKWCGRVNDGCSELAFYLFWSDVIVGLPGFHVAVGDWQSHPDLCLHDSLLQLQASRTSSGDQQTCNWLRCNVEFIDKPEILSKHAESMGSWAVNYHVLCLHRASGPHTSHLTLKKTFAVCVLTVLALLWLMRDETDARDVCPFDCTSVLKPTQFLASLVWRHFLGLPRHGRRENETWRLTRCCLTALIGGHARLSHTAGRQRAHLCCVSMASSSFALLWLARHKEHRQVEVTTASTTCQAWVEEEKGNYGPVCTVWMRRGDKWKEASTEINVSNLHKYLIQPAFW